MTDSNPARRTRRPSGVVESDILKAACEIFETKGYSNATTREIAAEAQVAETLIFRHFGSKAALFRAAVIVPFGEDLKELADRFDPAAPTRDFFNALLDLLQRERAKLTALLSVTAFDSSVNWDDPDGSERSPVRDIFAPLEQIVTREADFHDLRNLDIGATSAISLATILGIVVFEDWLFDKPLSKKQTQALRREALQQLAFGMTSRPG